MFLCTDCQGLLHNVIAVKTQNFSMFWNERRPMKCRQSQIYMYVYIYIYNGLLYEFSPLKGVKSDMVVVETAV